MWTLIKSLFVLVAALVGLAFGSSNFQSTTVDLLFTAVHAPLVVIIGSTFVVGMLIGLLASGIRILKLREQLRRAKRPSASTPSPDAAPKTGTDAPKLR